MKAKIIKIGNSLGIRIPKPLLEESGVGTDVDITARNGKIIIKPSNPRHNWDSAFKQMAANQDDELLDTTKPTNLTDWDDSDWEW